MASVLKYFFLFSFGGIVYVLIEMLWRGYSHWSMFILGGICFVLLGLINKKYTFVNTNADRHIYNNINGIYLRVYF